MSRCVYICVVDTFAVLLLLGVSWGHAEEAVKVRCPGDYRRRVETCIMEAQLAPQAGGGVTLVFDKDAVVNLCHRGILRKTIDCLQEIHSRCVHNVSVLQELNRLYSVPRWEMGAHLICQDTQLFQDNFDCMFRSANSVTSCILMRTQTFRMQLTFTDPADHTQIKDVTCSFAESIVKCLCSPLESQCPSDLTQRVASGMRFFLPPVCVSNSSTPSPTISPATTTTPTTTTTTTTTSTTTETHSEDGDYSASEDKNVTVKSQSDNATLSP